MSIENSAWFDDLKYGNLFERVQNIVFFLRLCIKVFALELVVIGGLVLGATYMFKTRSGTFIRYFFATSDTPAGLNHLFPEAWALKTFNVDGCLEEATESIFNGFSIVALAGFMCLVLGFWRSVGLDYTCLLVLVLALAVESRELKSFDNVLTPVQNNTMKNMRQAIIENQLTLSKELMSAMDLLMLKGDCCGVVSGSDMKQLRDTNSKLQLHGWVSEGGGLGPFYSICWKDDYDASEATGCYVHYFEVFLKPFIRNIYGLAMLSQVFLFALILAQSEVPAAKQDAFRIYFYDRKPTPFPVD